MRARDKLSAGRVKAAKHPGTHTHHHRIADGAGLYLQVTAAGTKSWVFRWARDSQTHLIGLGAYNDSDGITLKEAREKADVYRRTLVEGGEPITLHGAKKATQKANRAVVRAAARPSKPGSGKIGHPAALPPNAFQSVAEDWIRVQAPGWKHPKHDQQVRNSLASHVFPLIGSLKVDEIDTSHVRRVLEPIWLRIPETGRRVRMRLEQILSFAKVNGLRTGDNPAVWKGHLALTLPSHRHSAREEHFPSLPWQRMPEFMAALRKKQGCAPRALEFLIYTAARTGEVTGAVWSELDLEAALWVIPAGRMKGHKEQRVPLTAPALTVLREMLPARSAPDSIVFQSPTPIRSNEFGPLSNAAMLELLKRMDSVRSPEQAAWTDQQTGKRITPHGFRSTFRVWVSEATTHPRELAEAALAHVIESKVEAAYQRGDMLSRRTQMMIEWASYITGS